MCGCSGPEGITRKGQGTPRVTGLLTFLSHTAKAATNTSGREELRKLSGGHQKELPQSSPPKQAL